MGLLCCRYIQKVAHALLIYELNTREEPSDVGLILKNRTTLIEGRAHDTGERQNVNRRCFSCK